MFTVRLPASDPMRSLVYCELDVLRINNGNLWFPASVADLRTAIAVTATQTSPTLYADYPCITRAFSLAQQCLLAVRQLHLH